ncbi:NUDIX hydrolase [Rhizosaccharibacter radicis]|uniref:NUDIX hydrolase n=1 Tax=Rhizosaccharibacter radicis TaxID=2782605 RepID=A0ABT1VUA0_9PROT|nr:NUDIX hydrolase [Acetobacteraceae bacterium KSS12]
MDRPPFRPVVGCLAVVIRDGAALLVRRAKPPDQGRWGFPGGHVERGERFADAAVRELREETGVVAEPAGLLDALDIFRHAPDGSLSHHYVLLAVRCFWRSGEPVAADDALEAAWMPLDRIPRHPDHPDFSDDTGRVASLAAAAVARSGGRPTDR